MHKAPPAAPWVGGLGRADDMSGSPPHGCCLASETPRHAGIEVALVMDEAFSGVLFRAAGHGPRATCAQVQLRMRTALGAAGRGPAATGPERSYLRRTWKALASGRAGSARPWEVRPFLQFPGRAFVCRSSVTLCHSVNVGKSLKAHMLGACFSCGENLIMDLITQYFNKYRTFPLCF